ncbi:RNA polymerase sigma factor [Aquimarina sp. TRL1]|uniref:RNA polymerase sigma factor n=1 Tax=Aquimarina sp. (strain TRL1) TaxID=2736252 RepID=UPI0015887E91|nr:RNA polymerase sigma factor [Aquimarina sp. TRL1]QKX04376.1 RNA polymerase sigma factor [Aquimarina sp. TRL1]
MGNKIEHGVRLWREIKKGNTVALNELYCLYVDSLFSYGMRYVNNQNIVKDSIHDLFLDIYKYRKSLSEVSNAEYYLYRSLRRKISRQSKREIKEISSENIVFTFTEERSIEDVLINEETVEEHTSRLSDALCRLPEKQREAIQYRYHNEKTYEEIAEIMGTSIETVRTQVYRAIKKLRVELKDMEYSEGVYLIFLLFGLSSFLVLYY